MLPLSFYPAAAAASSAAAVSVGRSASLSNTYSASYKPWDVKQEGGQRDSGWGTGKILPISMHFNNTKGLTI